LPGSLYKFNKIKIIAASQFQKALLSVTMEVGSGRGKTAGLAIKLIKFNIGV